jgi:hypothetical protein
MPIEIKELHIRVAVTTSSSNQPTNGQTAAGGRNPTGNDATEMLVAECVEQVLHILQNKTER